MRIISGTARGKQLKTFKTNTIRPTSDRVREALFSILTSKIGTLEGIKVLDICAGTGALGIEALSRGAGLGVFIDSSHQATDLITQNCRICHLDDKAEILRGGFGSTLPRLQSCAFELIFIDPPYNKNMLPEIIARIESLDLLAAGGLICAEESKNAEVKADMGGYTCIDTRCYGDTCVFFFSTERA
jgi:16S rRNA (guanine(966)-N(2))-methyltransferase RsmD